MKISKKSAKSSRSFWSLVYGYFTVMAASNNYDYNHKLGLGIFFDDKLERGFYYSLKGRQSKAIQ
jgi:hypothetical protein